VGLHGPGGHTTKVDPCQAHDDRPKYGTPDGTAPTHVTLLSDMSHDDSHVHASLDMPTLEECTDEYDDKEVSDSFNYVAFSSSLALGRDLSRLWVVDSACSINSTDSRDDFVKFDPPSGSSRVGSVGVDVKGSGTVHIVIPLMSGQFVRLHSPCVIHQ
jgi:hypothetical protein